MLRTFCRARPLALACGLALAALGAPTGTRAATLTVIGDVNAGAADNLRLYENALNGGSSVIFSRGFSQLSGVVSHFRALGATLTQRPAPLTDLLLSAADFLVMTTGYNMAFDYTAAELAAARRFSDAGGAILMVAEGNAATVLDSYNAALEGLGGKIRFTGARFARTEVIDGLPETPLTEGMTSFRVSPYSTLTGGTEAVRASGGTVIAFEDLGAPPFAPVALPPAMPMLAAGLGGLAALALVGNRSSGRRRRD